MLESEEFPLSPKVIAREQEKDHHIRHMKRSDPEMKIVEVEGHQLLAHGNKIVIPPSLQGRIVWWYHIYLQHPGQKRMEATLRQNLTWPNLRKDVEKFVRTCKKCQKNKKIRQKYGHLPEKKAERPIPWNGVNVYLIGSLT